MSETEARLKDIIWDQCGMEEALIESWYEEALKCSPEELRLLADWKEENFNPLTITNVSRKAHRGGGAVSSQLGRGGTLPSAI